MTRLRIVQISKGKILQNIKRSGELILLQMTVNAMSVSFTLNKKDRHSTEATYRVVRSDKLLIEGGSSPLKLLEDMSLHKRRMLL